MLFHEDEENTINMHAGYPDYRLRQAQNRSNRPLQVCACIQANSIPDT
jgi:hypothetical protein